MRGPGPRSPALRSLRKRALAELYLAELEGHNLPLAALAERLGLPLDACEELARELAEEGLLSLEEGPEGISCELTAKGREAIRVVMTGGVFDVLHVGHLATLEAARELGDVLVVVVARDETVRRLKGREPLNSEQNRLKLVSALKPVDLALLGDPEDFYKTVELIRPDVIALGYDQRHDEGEIREELARRGLEAEVIRLGVRVEGVKSSRILAKLMEEF